MHMFAIYGSLKLPRVGSVAIMSATLLCGVAGSGPARSADLPYDYHPYAPRYGNFYQPQFDCFRCAPPRFVEPRPFVRVPVGVRHWVERDYLERRFPPPWRRFGFPGYGYSYPRPPADIPPPRYGRDYPPAPAAFAYDAPPPARYAEPARRYDLRPAYEYEPSPQASYDYENGSRPPAQPPSGYYNRGYVE